MKYFFFVTSRSNTMFISFWEIGYFEQEKKRVTKTALIVFQTLIIASFSARKSGSDCHPRLSRGAYFTILKVNCRTLASRSPDFSRINFALNFLIRFVRIRRLLIYRFSKPEIFSSRLNMRVGAALRYCLTGFLFARGLTGLYLT